MRIRVVLVSLFVATVLVAAAALPAAAAVHVTPYGPPYLCCED